jgi:hypothetical protein
MAYKKAVKVKKMCASCKKAFVGTERQKYCPKPALCARIAQMAKLTESTKRRSEARAARRAAKVSVCPHCGGVIPKVGEAEEERE